MNSIQLQFELIVNFSKKQKIHSLCSNCCLLWFTYIDNDNLKLKLRNYFLKARFEFRL